MSFVKLDCGILESTLWVDQDLRDVFITALLMAYPFEVRQPTPALLTDSIKESGFVVPPGWYGKVEAASVGIVRRSLVGDFGKGMEAIRKLAEPDPESRSADFDGRRMVRVDGGFLILNYIKYRDRDHTASERMRRFRDRVRRSASGRSDVTGNVDGVTRNVTPETRHVTQADSREEKAELKKNSSPNAPRSRVRELDPEALAHFEQFWSAYGKKVGRAAAERAWGRLKVADRDAAVAGVPRYVAAQPDPKFRKDPERWLKHRCWLDEVAIGGATRGGVVPKSLPVGSYLTLGDDPVQTL